MTPATHTECASPTSPRLLRALAPFGLTHEQDTQRRHRDRNRAHAGADRLLDAAEHIDRSSGRGAVVLITGPTGAGKSSLLNALAQRVPCVAADRARVHPTRALAEHRASMPLDDWLALLSRAGLADARLLATPAGKLSEGERARLRLALAMASVPTGGWLVVDECCTPLDRDTAAGVAATLRRWADRARARVVAASAHADLTRLLGPDLVVRCRPGVEPLFETGPGTPRLGRVRIEPGDHRDYLRLAPHHYRPGRPASPCRILRATVRGETGRRLAGVLVVTHPTLNGSWRELIWPGRYASPDKPRLARRLNRELRRISRVIVDPRDRGRGIARRLVRAYLDDPCTPATEAVAAMGRLSPFGRAAGMTEYPLPPRHADDRLADVLCAAGVEPWMLLDAESAARPLADPFLAAEITRWARAVWVSIPKPVRTVATPSNLAPLAAARLCAPPVAYGAS